MLMAKDENDYYVSLLSLPEQEIIECRKRIYYCPCCQGRVFLKAGKIKIPHFAHAPHLTCTAASEGESEEHLSGKKQLYEWLLQTGYQAELEKYFPAIQQRADLYVRHGGKSYAIEFQCSVISHDQLIKRTKMYKSQWITPIWILSSRHIKWKKANGFSVSSFQWLTAFGTVLQPKLIAYSPKSSQFTILQQLTPFSERHAFAFPKIISQSQLSFDDLLRSSPLYPLRTDRWQMKKQVWRFYAASYATIDDPFYKALYQIRISPAVLPNEIGLPIPYMHVYETNAIEWQFWLYEQVLSSKSIGERIFRSEWRKALIHCLKEKKITIRLMPQFQSIDLFRPMEQYMYMLEGLGIIQADGENYSYTKKIEPHNLHAPEKEEQFYKQVKKVYEELMHKAEKKLN